MKNIRILSVALLWVVSVECRPINHANNHHDVAHYAVAGYGQKSNSFDHSKAVHKAGSVDAGFATDGYYEKSTGRDIRAMQVQPDGKIILAGRNSSTKWYVGRLNADGSLDTGFGTEGFYTNNTGTRIDAMKLQSDGKVLIAGYNGSSNWYVGRLNVDGSLDTTFGVSGFYENSTGSQIYAMEVQADGKIVLAGYKSGTEWYVGRLNADGSLDTTFGSSGFYDNNTGKTIFAVGLQVDGKIVLAGYKGSSEWYVGRLNTDGSLDTTFGSSGFYDNNTGRIIYAMKVQQDDKVVIAGHDSNSDWYVQRLNADGSVDSSFGSNNYYGDPTGYTIREVQLQNDGKIILAGNTNGTEYWYVGRLNADGSLDTDFATNGFYTHSTGEIIYSMELQADGKIVIAGDDGGKWYVGRLHNDVDLHKHHIFHHSGESLGLLG